MPISKQLHEQRCLSLIKLPLATSTFRLFIYTMQPVIHQLCPKTFSAWTSKIPGIIIRRERPEGTDIYLHGYADVKNKIPVTPKTLFMIGSISKTFTAALILKLEELGKLKITDKVAPYLPAHWVENIANVKDATIQDLLQHVSGIPDYTHSEPNGANTSIVHKITNFGFFRWLFNPKLTREELASCAFRRPASNKLREKHTYSNTNYFLLRPVIEKATGMSIEQAFNQYLFKPMGLKHTYTGIPSVFSTKGYSPLSLFLKKDGETNWFNKATIGSSVTDGGIVSNVEDLSRFMKQLFQNGVFLSKQSLQKMLNPSDKNPISYGLGILLNTLTGCIWHNGLLDGYQALSIYNRSKNETITALANRSPDSQTISLEALVHKLVSDTHSIN